MSKHTVFCLALLLISGPSAGAQAIPARPDSGTVPPGRRGVRAEATGTPRDTLRITWPDIIQLAEEHPRLAAAREEVIAARGAAAAAGALPNPSLDATLAQEAPGGTPPNPRDWSLELALPLDWVTQRAFRVGGAAAQLDAGREAARGVRRDVLLELRMLFWNLACDQARVAALESLHDQTAELVRLVTRRVEKGEARPSEATRAEIELEKVTIELEADQYLLRARQDQARLWIRGSAEQELWMEADLTSVPGVPDLEAALSAARAAHPSILAARARVRGLSSALGLENIARLPALELRGFAESEPDRRTRGGGIAVDVPLWNWNSGRIAQARAQLAAGRQELEWETRQTESAVIEAHGACQSATRAAVRYRDRILPLSESAAAIMEKTYRVGEASLLEVIDARRVLVETRREYLAVLLQAQLDCSHLNALIGQEDAP